ncbi:MAG TPA: SURF1 family cytochrome oxidase biogenesis protein [Xanthobacteraceae bacterium]
MTAVPSLHARGVLAPSIAAALAVLALLALGTWQIARKAWKETLIATIAERSAAAPIDLPAPATWPQMSAENFEFRRVRLGAEFLAAEAAYLHVAGSALREDVRAPGYFVFAPARLAGGAQVVVNQGYLPSEAGLRRPITGRHDIVGYLRWPERRPWFVADHDAAGRVWFVRDPVAMAEAKGWGRVAPFYIDQEGPVPAGGLPRPGRLRASLSNPHLSYALTWYGLAAVVAASFAVWFVGRRRGQAGAPP